MRIVAGKYRGKKLFSPLSSSIRPTSDRARESLFNILNSHIEDWQEIKLLDVFCGTGAFGLEGLSRGAGEVCLIDIDLATAQKNATLFTQEKNKIKIIKANATKLPQAPHPFTLIFLDAPYHQALTEAALHSLLEKGWIDPEALIIVEMKKNEDFMASPFTIIDQRIYGLAKFIFLHL